jgi:biopolymer transport protein ExbB/TolQ
MADTSLLNAVDCTRRAAERAAVVFHRELDRGTTSLKFVACVAPLLGMFGTALLLISALPYYYIPAWRNYDVAGGLADTLVPFILSLPVAIFAFHFLRHNMEIFDLEMHTATFDLLNNLARRQRA